MKWRQADQLSVTNKAKINNNTNSRSTYLTVSKFLTTNHKQPKQLIKKKKKRTIPATTFALFDLYAANSDKRQQQRQLQWQHRKQHFLFFFHYQKPKLPPLSILSFSRVLFQFQNITNNRRKLQSNLIGFFFLPIIQVNESAEKNLLINLKKKKSRLKCGLKLNKDHLSTLKKVQKNKK